MKHAERLYNAIEFKPVDRPPHFELMFELCEEAFGIPRPTGMEYQLKDSKELEKVFRQCGEIYAKTVERYQWDAVTLWCPRNGDGSTIYDFTQYLMDYLGEDITVIPPVWNSVVCIETIEDYMQFSIDLLEEPHKVHDMAKRLLERGLRNAEGHLNAGCKIICLPCDSAFNGGPFMSPDDFAEFTIPYLKELIDYIHGRGAKAIFHSDGYLMPILEQIVEVKPDVIHSIDPMAGMDIAEVKKITYGKAALMGNVKCSSLQDGKDEEIKESVDYALEHASKGSGFIFSSSNCVFKGLPLQNYEKMLGYYWDFVNNRMK